ncbi:LOW QUALITY PROTEIN: hypothetical protein M8C21_007332, partial [Ambrosia artemisiifolia]
LRLSCNNLTGILPTTFGGSKIQNIWLNNQLQGLSGTLDVISSMTQLYQVWLQGNAFTGAIPDLSKCINLFDLQLKQNQLTGLVPSSLMSLPNLANITLQENKLQGPLPIFQSGVRVSLGLRTNRFCLATPGNCDPQVMALLEVAKAIAYPILLAEYWVGNNACANWSFITCDSSQKNVTNVDFSNMKFSGTISPSFGNLTSLRRLSLNDNNLTGFVPKILTSLPDLQLLHLSKNNLSRPVPQFPQKVKPHESTPNSSALDGSPPPHSQGKLVSTGMGLCHTYVTTSVTESLLNYKVKHHNHTPSSENGNLMISIQVLNQVTNNFNDKNVLGRGGFGVVYKGEFDDGSMIAVKRVKLETKGMKEFQAEIGVLTKVRHRHLVAFLGYCINGNERLLVYEYMSQGTLSQHLFEWRKLKSHALSWKQRVSIALDVGRGVEYLHSLAQQHFIHRDSKSANILLDDDMRAKVPDFGLVKIVADGKHSVDTRLAGTFGYLPPEYVVWKP